MNEPKREVYGSCVACEKDIYYGDVACHFYSDEILCEEHATTLKEGISHLEELLRDGELGPYKTEEELRNKLVEWRRLYMQKGNIKLWADVVF